MSLSLCYLYFAIYFVQEAFYFKFVCFIVSPRIASILVFPKASQVFDIIKKKRH